MATPRDPVLPPARGHPHSCPPRAPTTTAPRLPFGTFDVGLVTQKPGKIFVELLH